MNMDFRQATEAGGSAGTLTAVPQVVLVPLLNMGLAGDMLGLAAHLMRDIGKDASAGASDEKGSRQAHIVVLSVVQVPPDQPLTMGMDMARSYRALLDFLPSQVEVPGYGSHEARQVRVDRIVKVARDVAGAIRQAAVEEGADLVLVYWKGYARRPKQHVYGRIVDEVLAEPSCGVMAARVEGWNRARRVMLSVRGGPGAEYGLSLSMTLAERMDLPLTVLHNVPRIPTVPNLERFIEEKGVSLVEALGEEPYLVFNEQLRRVREERGARFESILTRGDDPAQAILSEAQADDIVIMGMAQHEARERGRTNEEGIGEDGEASIGLKVSERKGPPLLMLNTPVSIDLKAYSKRLRANKSVSAGKGRGGSKRWLDMPFEHWFVEHTFHGDEFRDPEEFLRAKRVSGLSLSVVVLTSNDAGRIHSVIMGLRRVLQELHPLADQIVVVDAGSSDGTRQIARDLGAEVYEAAEILPGQGNLHGRGESWWKSLAVAKGDLVVWLDPRARRFHPSTALALAGPLLRIPTLQMVKAFGGDDEGRKTKDERRRTKDQGQGREEFSPVDISWGGFVVPRRGDGDVHPQVRVQALRPSDLEALDMGQLAMLPPRTLFQVLCPALAGVIAPFGRDMAARRGAMMGMPVFTEDGLETGLLLSVVGEFGSNAIAQVELGEGRPAQAPQPGLRSVVDLLEVMSRRLQDSEMKHYAKEVAERLTREIEGKRSASADDGESGARMFEVRALGPVERPPMKIALRGE